MFRETMAGGPVAASRRIARHTPAMLLGLFLLATSAYMMFRDYSDDPAIEVVMLTNMPLSPEPEIEEMPLAEVKPEAEVVPEPIPEPKPVEVAEVKPKPVPKKPEPPKAKPKPPPPALAERPPPPPPKPAVKPRPRPKPVIPQIAKVEPPKPKPVVRPERPKRVMPKPVARPKVEIARVAPKPIPVAPKPQRIARAQIKPPTAPRKTPKLSAPAAPNFDQRSAPEPKRAFRVAKSQTTSGKRPRALPGLAPVPSGKGLAPPAPGPRAERSKPSRSMPKSVRRPPAIAPAMTAAKIPSVPTPRLPDATRKSRDKGNSSDRRARPKVAIAAATPSLPKPSISTPSLASRAGRDPAGPRRASSAARPGVDGVPLGDLAACMTDREEDRLKQAVVAAVKTQEECVSRKGTYRFIETKNMNAFLMWIDRAPSRDVEDRCGELRHALECLQGASQRAAR